MSISFEYYKVFYYVSKYKQISLAAEKLYISQPAVTQTIKKLEEQIGGKLFVRTSDGMKLTEEGNRLYDYVSESIKILEDTESRFGKYKRLEEGKITIRAGSNVAKFLLYDALERFSKEYPNIKVKISTGAPKESVQMLYNGVIDIIMLYLPYQIEYNNLKVIECAKKEYILAMSKKYYEENNVKIKKIEDLNNYSLIIPKEGSSVRGVFDNIFKDKIKQYHYEVAAEQVKKEFIIRGMGIGFIIKDEIEKELQNGEVIQVILPGIVVNESIGIIVQDEHTMSFATRELVKYIKGEK